MKKIILLILIIIPVTIFIYCNYSNKDAAVNTISLSPIETIDLDVPEPSGLHFDEGSNTLWVVSDENSTIYNITPNGTIIKKLSVAGFDLEGITIINDSVLAVILERDRVIVLLDKTGNEINRIKVDISGEPNKGLEGIVYNNSRESFIVVNEKAPGLLLEIDSLGKTISQHKLSFATDYSGLFYNEQENNLWITSDEDRALFKCSIDGKVIEKYLINIDQIEGVSIDFKNSLLYIISDPLEQLYIFRLP